MNVHGAKVAHAAPPGAGGHADDAAGAGAGATAVDDVAGASMWPTLENNATDKWDCSLCGRGGAKGFATPQGLSYLRTFCLAKREGRALEHGSAESDELQSIQRA